MNRGPLRIIVRDDHLHVCRSWLSERAKSEGLLWSWLKQCWTPAVVRLRSRTSSIFVRCCGHARSDACSLMRTCILSSESRRYHSRPVLCAEEGGREQEEGEYHAPSGLHPIAQKSRAASDAYGGSTLANTHCNTILYGLACLSRSRSPRSPSKHRDECSSLVTKEHNYLVNFNVPVFALR